MCTVFIGLTLHRYARGVHQLLQGRLRHSYLVVHHRKSDRKKEKKFTPDNQQENGLQLTKPFSVLRYSTLSGSPLHVYD